MGDVGVHWTCQYGSVLCCALLQVPHQIPAIGSRVCCATHLPQQLLDVLCAMLCAAAGLFTRFRAMRPACWLRTPGLL
jgi:hypothetical protein